jgi:hypothetical protein
MLVLESVEGSMNDKEKYFPTGELIVNLSLSLNYAASIRTLA